jgi:predicted permease
MIVRSLAAVAVGFVIAIILYQLGAAVAFLVLYGIPLGYSGAPPGAGYYALNLSFSAAAAFIGACAAVRIARRQPLLHSMLLGTALAVLAVWGFSRPESQWPGWYPPTLAFVGAAGSIAGGRSCSRPWRRN